MLYKYLDITRITLAVLQVWRSWRCLASSCCKCKWTAQVLSFPLEAAWWTGMWSNHVKAGSNNAKEWVMSGATSLTSRKVNHGFQWHGHSGCGWMVKGQRRQQKIARFSAKGSGWFRELRRVLCRNAFCVLWMVSTGAASCRYWNTFTWCNEPLPSKLTRPIVCQQLLSVL